MKNEVYLAHAKDRQKGQTQERQRSGKVCPITPLKREEKREERVDEQLSHYHFVLNSLAEDQGAQVPSLINEKLKQKIVSIRNRGIVTYLAENRRKKNSDKKKEIKSFQPRSFSLEGQQSSQRRVELISNRGLSPEETIEVAQWKKAVAATELSPTAPKPNSDSKVKMQQFKDIYINSVT